MTEFEFGDIVKCMKADRPTTGPLKEGALYVVEGVAQHGKSIKVAGDWHRVGRFIVIGKSDLDSRKDDRELANHMNASVYQIDAAQRALSSAFTWVNSPEGEDYWREVYQKLGSYVERFRDL